MLCPQDCRPCRHPQCHAASCRLTGEPMMEICQLCGEVMWGEKVMCPRCAGGPPGWRSHRPRTVH